MKSGLIVERRDQVLIIFLELGPSARTFLFRWSSINGPFFIERAIVSQPLNELFTALFDYEAVRSLVSTRFVTLGRNTPWCYRVTSARSTPLTTTMWMVNRVHSNTAYFRTPA